MTFKDRSFSFYFTLWLGVLLVLAGSIGVMPAYRHYKKWRALGLIQEIRTKDLPAGDFDAAARKLRLAHGYSQRLPEVLRLSGEMLARGGREEAMQYYAMLIETGQGTSADRIAYAREALRRDRPEIARAQLRQALQNSPLNREALMLGIQALERLNFISEARKLAKAALAAHPSDDEAIWRLANLEYLSGDLTSRESGRQLLWSLAMSASDYGSAAVGLLASEPKLERSELNLLAKSLESLPRRSLAQELLAYDLRYRLAEPDQRAPLVKMVRQRLGTQPTPLERITVADWLLAHQAPESVPEVITEALGRQNSAAAQRWLQAYANQGNWEIVSALVEDLTLAIGPELRHCYRAILKGRAGDTNGVAFHLNQAVGALHDSASLVLIVAQYAEKLGQPAIAAQAYEKLLAQPAQAAAAAREILRILAPSDDVELILRSLKRLREFQPESEEIADFVSWYELLTRQNLTENSRLAAERMKKFPDLQRFRLTAVLAKLQENNPEGALGLLEGQSRERTNATPKERLLYVAALGQAGQRETARRWAATLNLSTFKRAELDLVRPWVEAE